MLVRLVRLVRFRFSCVVRPYALQFPFRGALADKAGEKEAGESLPVGFNEFGLFFLHFITSQFGKTGPPAGGGRHH